MADITYQLVLQNAQGASVPGVLTYRFLDAAPEEGGNIDRTLVLKASSEPTELSVFSLGGTLSIPELLGSKPAPVAGLAYVSLLGPTLTSIFTDDGSPYSFSLQIAYIDSALKNVGGSFGLRQPDGEDQPWGFLGTLQS